MRKCNGVKVCEYTRPEIANMSHTSVDMDSHFQQEINHSNVEQKTWAFYLSLQKRHKQCTYVIAKSTIDQDGSHVPPLLCEGEMVLKQFSRISESGGWYIGCSRWTYEVFRDPTNKHRLITVKDGIDISTLRGLLENNTAEIEDTESMSNCSTVLCTRSHQKSCDIPHRVDGQIVQGKIIHKVN